MCVSFFVLDQDCPFNLSVIFKLLLHLKIFDRKKWVLSLPKKRLTGKDGKRNWRLPGPSPRGRRKKERGRGEGEKRESGERGREKGKGKVPSPLSPIPLIFFPSSPSPFRRLLRRLTGPGLF